MEHCSKIRQFLLMIFGSFLKSKGDSISILKVMTVKFFAKGEEVRFGVPELILTYGNILAIRM